MHPHDVLVRQGIVYDLWSFDNPCGPQFGHGSVLLEDVVDKGPRDEVLRFVALENVSYMTVLLDGVIHTATLLNKFPPGFTSVFVLFSPTA